MADRLQRMPVRHERLMRRMGIVFSNLVILGSIAVISHGLLVVIGSGCVVFCYPVLGGHDCSSSGVPVSRNAA